MPTGFPRLVLHFLLLLASTLASGPTLAGQATGRPEGSTAHPPATVSYLNREIVVLRAAISNATPAERALVANARIARIAAADGARKVEVRDVQGGKAFTVDGERVFTLFTGDLDASAEESLAAATERAQRALETVMAEGRELHEAGGLVVGILATAAATLVLYVLLRLLWRARRWATERAAQAVEQRVQRIRLGGMAALQPRATESLVRGSLAALTWILTFVAIFLWLEFSLLRFPYTRPHGEHLLGTLLDVVASVGIAVLGSVPGLVMVAVIFVIARACAKMLALFFERVESHRLDLRWVDADTAATTRRIAVTLVWLFAIAIAYPFIPGSEGEAFKGVSVLIGLMITLGSTSIVGQAVSGLILVYARMLKPGEYVRVADNEGTITSVGMFTTKMLSNMGEEISIPNSVILGTTTKNFSRPPGAHVGTVYTSVTIGYSTPWRQVHAMLLSSAAKTPGLRTSPAPHVLQIALNDFYVEYRLCAGIEKPVDRLIVLDALHQNIQDTFNEFGVQIMSPHYLADPTEPAIVPRDKWYTPPADRPPGA